MLKKDGVYATVSYPSQLQIREADVAYLGGHIHEVSAEEAAALDAAGYDVEEV